MTSSLRSRSDRANQGRFIRARVVGRVEFAGDGGDAYVAGPKRKATKVERQIRLKLRRARALKRRISRLRSRQRLGWKAAVQKAKANLCAVMSDLKALGWKPKKPSRARKPGEDEMDAALDDIPEPEPGETEEPDDDGDEPPEAPEAPEPDATEGSWLDGYVGAEPVRRQVADLYRRAGVAMSARWSRPVPLGDGAQLQTRPGQRAMIMAVSPGLFVVQLDSEQAVRKLAGDNVGVLPLVLFPLVRSRVLQRLAPQAAPTPAPAPPAAAPPPPAPVAPVGCDGCRPRR